VVAPCPTPTGRRMPSHQASCLRRGTSSSIPHGRRIVASLLGARKPPTWRPRWPTASVTAASASPAPPGGRWTPSSISTRRSRAPVPSPPPRHRRSVISCSAVRGERSRRTALPSQRLHRLQRAEPHGPRERHPCRGSHGDGPLPHPAADRIDSAVQRVSLRVPRRWGPCTVREDTTP
jgi:hypothetical protein